MVTKTGTKGKAKEGSAELRINQRKWGKPLVEAGWTLFPNTLLLRQKALGLTSTDINILLHLLSHWWTKENLPHPSKATLAKSMGVTSRTVQRRIAAMESAGFIKRISRSGPNRGTQTNEYDFTGLIEEATPFAKELLKERAERKKKAADRAGRTGRPHLRVVDNED